MTTGMMGACQTDPIRFQKKRLTHQACFDQLRDNRKIIRPAYSFSDVPDFAHILHRSNVAVMAFFNPNHIPLQTMVREELVDNVFGFLARPDIRPFYTWRPDHDAV